MLFAAQYPFLSIVWSMLVFFGLFLWLLLLFRAFGDLFGRHDISGWAKVGWCALMLFVPLLGVLIYFLTQGHGIAERASKAAQQAKQEMDEYVRDAAGADAATEITKAKELLDNGAIDQAEFNRLKAKALA